MFTAKKLVVPSSAASRTAMQRFTNVIHSTLGTNSKTYSMHEMLFLALAMLHNPLGPLCVGAGKKSCNTLLACLSPMTTYFEANYFEGNNIKWNDMSKRLVLGSLDLPQLGTIFAHCIQLQLKLIYDWLVLILYKGHQNRTKTEFSASNWPCAKKCPLSLSDPCCQFQPRLLVMVGSFKRE